MRTLVALSGGLDSTLLLALMREQGYAVAFWMDESSVVCSGTSMPDFYARVARYEYAAARNVAEALNIELLPPVPLINSRPPTDRPQSPNSRDWRVWPMLQAASRLMKPNGCDRFVYGKTLENIRTPGWEERDRWNREWWARETGTVYEVPLVDMRIGKPHALTILPKPVSELCLSCDSPVLGGACGRCSKCCMVALSKAFLAQGIAPDAIFDFLLKRRGAGPYIGMRSGDVALGWNATPPPTPDYED